MIANMHTVSGVGRLRAVPAIRQALLEVESATKAEISERVGISFPTISKILTQMEEEGEVRLVGLAQSSGGRRAAKYAYNPEHMWGLALFLEKEKTQYIIFDCSGKIKRRGSRPSVLVKGGMDLLTALIEELLSAGNARIKALSIGVPGAVERGRIIYIPGYEEFSDIDLAARYGAHFSMPVVVENDMNAAVLGYHSYKGSTEDQSLVYLYSGQNGPGAGILVNGEVVRGSTLFAGEISFVPQYEERNFGQAIAEASDQVDRVDAFSRLVAMFAATINPHTIILCSEEMEIGMVAKIATGSSRYIPAAHLPKLTLSDWEWDYLCGLRRLCLELLMNLNE